jgi:hypothetical protein
MHTIVLFSEKQPRSAQLRDAAHVSITFVNDVDPLVFSGPQRPAH